MPVFTDAYPNAGAAGPCLVLPNGEQSWSTPSPEVALYSLTDPDFLFLHSRRLDCNNQSSLDPADATGIEPVVEAFIKGLACWTRSFSNMTTTLLWVYRLVLTGLIFLGGAL